MWAWRCEEALLRAPRIPELWCEMRREKAYGRGCSATNHPFHRKSWSPSLDTCTLQGLSLSFLPLHGPPHSCVNSSPVSAALTRLWLACTASYSSVHLSAPGSTVPHTHTHTTSVFKTIWHVTRQRASHVQVRASFTLRWPMLHSFAHSLETWLSQLHQIVWDFISWKSDNFCPVSVHYYLEIPFTC